jgi:hypothetical protein
MVNSRFPMVRLNGEDVEYNLDKPDPLYEIYI